MSPREIQKMLSTCSTLGMLVGAQTHKDWRKSSMKKDGKSSRSDLLLYAKSVANDEDNNLHQNDVEKFLRQHVASNRAGAK